jgi:hypothetical protein
MKPGDKVKVNSVRDDTFQIMTVLEVSDKSVKLKHPDIGGFFMVAIERVEPMEE